jgi:hypothetical protein
MRGDLMDDLSDKGGDGLRQCPTRTDGAQVLFAHKVNNGQCQDRQRGLYHKCYTCAWNNNYVAKHGFPALAPKSSDLPATPALEVT